MDSVVDLSNNTGQEGKKTTFDILKFSMAAKIKEHKQKKLNDHVYSFLLFVSSRPQYRAEF